MIHDEIEIVSREILRIIIVERGKTIKDLNKIFQATLANYFFESNVCSLLSLHSQTGESRKMIKIRVEEKLKQ